MQQQLANWQALLTNSFDQFVSTFWAYLPNLFSALFLIIVGFIIAGFIRRVILRLSEWLEQFAQKSGIGAYYLRVQWPISRIVATIGYWLVLLFFMTAVAKSLGLPGIAEWLNKLIEYSPSLLVAGLIVWSGFILGDFAREKLSASLATSHIQQAERLGALARILVIALMFIIGLRHVGIDVKFLEQILLVSLAAGALALALAFGLGAGPTVANIIALRHLYKHYQPGQRVRMEQVEGEIVEFSKTAVVLNTDAGRVMVPARTFQEQACLALDEDD